MERIIEISSDQRHLHVDRGFLVIESHRSGEAEVGRVPLDEIAAVITNANGITYSNNLLVELADRGVPLVVCGANHVARGFLLGLAGHHQQAKRFDAQLNAPRPMRKRLWADLVRAKINQQSDVLDATGRPSVPLRSLVSKIRSGDPENIEAQAARRYWTLLFGADFRRDRSAPGLNAVLNYGYTVLRATVGRAVIAAGLHPTPALFHSNESNPMRLADDLMEPFRPLVDLAAWRLDRNHAIDLTTEVKRALVMVLYDDLQTPAGVTPVMACIQRLATSLAQVFLHERESLDLPFPGLPLDLASKTTES